MAKDVADTVRDTISSVIRDATQNLGDGKGRSKGGNGSPLSGMKGVAAGAGLAAIAPLAAKGAGKAVKRRIAGEGAKSAVSSPAKKVKDATSNLGDSVGKGVGEKVKEKVDESGGVGGLAKEAGKSVLPFGGGESDAKGGAEGVGKGRRMPVQQSMDVAVPIETAYNQWTQFEEWPNFMHRVTRVTQEDDATVGFASKMWGVTREFTADIETQRPEERIKWRVSQGITHTGVVTFHELAPRLTRIELTVDVDPGSLLEKAARGMRHIKRAMRADLHRFKAFIEMQEMETGAWRGVIEDGEVVQEHDESYDEERDYQDAEDAFGGAESESDTEAEADAEEPEEEQEEEDEGQKERSERFARQAKASSSRGRRSENGGSSGGRSRSRGSGQRKKAAGRS